jgi:hypothetical protein
MKVFWKAGILNPKTGKPTLCNARGEEDLDIAYVL